jgi:hypothetical protein
MHAVKGFVPSMLKNLSIAFQPWLVRRPTVPLCSLATLRRKRSVAYDMIPMSTAFPDACASLLMWFINSLVDNHILRIVGAEVSPNETES